MPLSDIKIRNLKSRDKAYKVSDFEGLFVLVKVSGAKSWRFKYRIDGKEKLLVIGDYPAVTLAKARQARDLAKAKLADGIDPNEAKQEDKRIRLEATHIETNLQNARELFQAFLQEIFCNTSDKWLCQTEQALRLKNEDPETNQSVTRRTKQDTKTGGRAAAERHILGDFGLSVKVPEIGTRQGWSWSLLTDLARLESGHTPSRRKAEYWGGKIPWMGIKDARNNHGATIYGTLENTNDTGINNSSARVLPKGTVCLSRTASVGYVAIMGRDMATSQDFVNWVCGENLEPEFLKVILLAQGKELFKFSSGAVHQTIYFPEAKGFAICHPNVETQRKIVLAAQAILKKSRNLEAVYVEKLQDLDDLRQSLLQKAFTGELT